MRAKRPAIGAASGLLLGLLMLIPLYCPDVRHLMGSTRISERAHEIVNYPALLVVFAWGHLSLPVPKGEWGEFELYPYLILVQWLLIGALAGLLFHAGKRKRITQPGAPGDGTVAP